MSGRHGVACGLSYVVQRVTRQVAVPCANGCREAQSPFRKSQRVQLVLPGQACFWCGWRAGALGAQK